MLTKDQLQHVADLFSRFRRGTREYLSRSDINRMLEETKDFFGFKPSKADADALIEFMDSDGNGKVDVQEFANAIAMFVHGELGGKGGGGARKSSGPPKGCSQKDYDLMVQIFNEYDRKGDGVLDRGDLERLLSSIDLFGLKPSEANQLMKIMDDDGDGAVDLGEFTSKLWEYLNLKK
eukprot:GFYU01003966.1.p2 GENE.GFYU01003966.1~~GFYU01003966.1.p2  ORF type:complete len:178 (+),score=69.12 GFYU01003966.1:1446-1979(+)